MSRRSSWLAFAFLAREALNAREAEAEAREAMHGSTPQESDLSSEAPPCEA